MIENKLDQKTISIVIPTYKGEFSIEQLIEELFQVFYSQDLEGLC